MRKSVLIFLAVSFNSIQAQKSCCSAPKGTESFAMLSNNKMFVSAHHEPLPFILPEPVGRMISFKTPDGKEGFAYEINPDVKTENVIFVIHEWWGLNDYIKKESEKIAKKTGAHVIALDLYDRKVATNRDSAGKYMQGVKTERAEAIIKGAISYVGANAKIATIGWCFGGGWSLQTSLLAGKQAKACVMYYGMPEENADKLKNLNAPVLFVFASRDEWINKDVLSKFDLNMKSAKKSLAVKSYDADHAFANPSNPHFNKALSDDAFASTIAFLEKNLN